MPRHAEQRVVAHTPEQMFELVADVGAYADFLPWCKACRVTKQIDAHSFLADLTVGHGPFHEKFTSKVTLVPKTEVRVEYMDGPLRRLTNRWVFSDAGQGRCKIDFNVDFEFKNPLMAAMVGVVFHEIVRRMVAAFEQRARALYSTP